MEIDWERQFGDQEKRFERFVACLLSTEYGSGIKRLDGSGGDGGRDCYLFRSGSSSADYFQVKCIFGRLSGKGRKAAIKKSFASAVANAVRPTSWTLVVPGNLTDAEERWLFKNCRAEGVEIDWRGEPWLDKMVGIHVNIRNHWFTDERDRVIEILAEKNFAETIGGPTISAVARKASAELDQLNNADAFFAYAIRSGSGGQTFLDVSERYPGAATDASTTLHVTARSDAAAAAIESHRDFGTGFMLGPDEATIEIRGDTKVAGRFMLAGADDVEFEVDPYRYMKLRLAEPHPEAAAQITLNPKRGTVGDRGAELVLADRLGFLVLRITFATDEEASRARINTSLHYPVGRSARELLPLVRFVQAANAGSSIVVETPESDAGGELATMDIPGDETDEFFQLIENWAEIERACDIDIPFPADGVTTEQADELHDVAMLLRGQSQRVPYDTIRVPLVSTDAARAIASKSDDVGSPARWTFIQDAHVSILGVRLPVRRAIFLADGVIENLAEMRAGATNEMVLTPATSTSDAVIMPNTALGAVGLHLDDDGNQVEFAPGE